ncbi:tripartite tricarboxylate transporter TctB family protein [Ensifer sp. YR511]|uniref:tripartite tricarboxylate transporter TctB family protein n=1 Tax=Ensifer sp. YR511 TaxID=1855294 RepID=UPI00089274B1|nr:tripartite tricarboxylate transporter TctB family protein [Ensifer sp. YR511]SDN41462.1 Tripartite tricarboxylate transporter TctB family protein [Ensifer sp. YR511]
MKSIDSDFAAGLLFLVIAAAFGITATTYGFGSVQRLGAGVFPLAVSCLLGPVGLVLVIKALRGRIGEAIAPIDLRALVSILAALLFAAATLRHAGIVVAVPGAVLIASRASRDLTVVQALGISAFLTIFVWAVFVLGFSVRLPLLAGVL